ncbi:NADH-quinone oxidoreductase subunit A [Nocardia farcinica]|uniref:NADH-quinone oxidoreductase subunit A n=1 Tax=Nocardia TaxID=1817 RepID=UPI0018945351|nr:MULTISPECIES: NADH-quinone oxidoreductase subunit A [Nocardia]MBF6289938.1 NADH-quinone oxidoreductase subunit A [Nocardia cyriacigeorgica]MBF6422218.1 NADH-quinone oxidoreductase subunit A [Nocardia farcinica]MBF6433874.1 NADH-quinone oxidoreductase subunit A [Nocardia farcinica]MBF6504942.1 NADH-quinone oxidoreductase subunit A [Nocardia farcinica]
MLNLLVVLAVVVVSLALTYAAASAGRSGPVAKDTASFLSGTGATEHALSRYHVRWYTITMIFLAFDMEMAFMYPWSVVVAELGAMAVAEMFGFLAVLVIAVLYAWREGALRWV